MINNYGVQIINSTFWILYSFLSFIFLSVRFLLNTFSLWSFDTIVCCFGGDGGVTANAAARFQCDSCDKICVWQSQYAAYDVCNVQRASTKCSHMCHSCTQH